MPDYADLEIDLRPRQENVYAVEMRFSLPGSDADNRSHEAQVTFNFDAFRASELDPADYGKKLWASLLGDPAALSAFERARALAKPRDPPDPEGPLGLRVRLMVDSTAAELHELRWETLCEPVQEPDQARYLCTSENILFSRYLRSRDWEPVRLRSKSDLRALVVVANPPNLAKYHLASVDVAAELERAKISLGPAIEVATLPDAGAAGQSPRHATLNTLADCLRSDHYDILYLVCHGALADGKPWLWLEDDTGEGEPHTLGEAFLNCLRDLSQRPRLVVLASCQSAAADTGKALHALGPRLAEAGVPAVLAMQGNMSMDTAAKFMPKFFEELQRDGQIERALAVARGAVIGRDDWWTPVLFTRLKSGRLWVEQSKGMLESWAPLVRSLQNKPCCQCTPVLGPGLTEPIFGSWHKMARDWAADNQAPLPAANHENLPQVAQYLAARYGPGFPGDTLLDRFKSQVLKRYGPDLPPNVADLELEALLQAAGALRRQRDPAEAFSILAGLPIDIYITANPDNLLEDALKTAGKDPQFEICRWKQDSADWESVYTKQPHYRPTPDQPLVYYLFGHIRYPNSLVLTEDDYFDYLMRVNRAEASVPTVVETAWKCNALLFLGFQMDDWNFRVLFRSILNDERRWARRRYHSVTAQIIPEEGQADPRSARSLLESYFKDTQIDIYWGGAEDFLKELWQRWPQKP